MSYPKLREAVSLRHDEDGTVQRVGRILLKGNVIVFNQTMFQISNICSVDVVDRSYRRQNALPRWILPCLLAALAWILLGVTSTHPSASVLGVPLLLAAARGFQARVPWTYVPKFELRVELSSGRTSRLTSSDGRLLVKATQALSAVLATSARPQGTIEFNFDNKTINVENAVDSVIVGGDVYESILENNR